MKTRRWLLWISLMSLLMIGAKDVIASCTTARTGSPYGGQVTVGVVSGGTDQDVQDGADLWQTSCPTDYGRTFPSISVIDAAQNPTYRVAFKNNNPGDDACGTFFGRDITVYAFATLDNGTTKHCGDRSQTLAHEFGHMFGLNDSPLTSACSNNIMSNITDANRNSRDVQDDECAAVAERWTTPLEESWKGGDGTDPDGGTQEDPNDPGSGTPLVLDLDGDGIHTSHIESGVHFDITGDGVLEQTAWTSPYTDEAFLWVDLNHNRRVDGGQELFGDAFMLPNGLRAEHGFEALAIFDRSEHGGNQDGWIDIEDDIWSRLLVWPDKNHNGRSDGGETHPLARHGIVAFDLSYDYDGRIDGNLNERRFESRYYFMTLTQDDNGHLVREVSSRLVEDVVFHWRHLDP